MSIRSRILLAVAASLLLTLYILPLWRITLVAPQYPEGLGMQIGVRTLTGVQPNDLDNINELNHYIGMRPIVPDAIPELRYLPWLVAALAAFGLVASAAGKRWLAITWLATFALGAVAGLADFYRWGYDYGHNLDFEHAIIKVPGMAYQPPLIGSKQLLNFTATSWPAAGGWLALVALGLGIAALFVDRRRRVTPRTRTARRARPAEESMAVAGVA